MSKGQTNPELEKAMAEALESVERIEREGTGEELIETDPAEVDTEVEPVAPLEEPEPDTRAADSSAAVRAEAVHSDAVDTEAADTEAVDAEAIDDEKAAALKDQLLRLAADFENFRKRSRKEKDELRQFAAESVIYDMLPVMDNLERALEHAGAEDPIAQGVQMVKKQFADALAAHGVVGFESKGTDFDPERHEAMGQHPTAEAPPGTVIQEMVKGYMLHSRLLRPAKVIVAAAPKGGEEAAAEAEAPEDAPANGAD